MHISKKGKPFNKRSVPCAFGIKTGRHFHQKALKTLSFQGFLLFIFRCHTAVGGTHDLWLCVCLFSVRGEGFRSECAVLIVNVKVTAEGGFEVNIDRQLSVLFVDDDVVYQQPQVGIADRTVFDDAVKDINTAFHFSFSLADGRVIITDGFDFRCQALNLRLAFFKHTRINVGVFTVTDTLQKYLFLIAFTLCKPVGQVFNPLLGGVFLCKPAFYIGFNCPVVGFGFLLDGDQFIINQLVKR